MSDTQQLIIDKYSLEVYDFIVKNLPESETVTFTDTGSAMHIELMMSQNESMLRSLVNFKRLNDMRFINKMLERINEGLEDGGILIGCFEPKEHRKTRILRKYPPIIRWFIYAADFFVRRVSPKVWGLKKLYFALTRGQNRVLAKMEGYGRLYSCGFTLLDTMNYGSLHFFACQKTGAPAYNLQATYGPLVRLKRVGKNGKVIKVYKLRTMFPYAEYIQAYVNDTFGLQEGGKFKNDPRVTTLGKFFRKFWLDEIPMIINVLKGEIKLIGGRPLSQHYLGLYPKEIQERRKNYKPGLLPPYYADLPKTLDEIVASEQRYMDAYDKAPLRTDLKYFLKIVKNILFKKARSK